MVGGIRLAFCPCAASPPVIPGLDFPGDGILTFRGNATSTCNYPALYGTGTGNAPCYTTPVVFVVGSNGVTQNLVSNVVSESTNPFTVTQNLGAYNSGVAINIYTCSGLFENVDRPKSLPDQEVLIIDAFNPSIYFGQQWYDYPCGSTFIISTSITTDIYTTDTNNISLSSSFTWLGVAQRDLPGIRVQRATGVTAKWLVSVNAGNVRLFREDGTDSYQTSGTLNQVVANINSVLAGKIVARVSGWGGYPSFGETNGNVAAGKSEYDYLFTKNDPSTMLKDLGPTYIQANFCNDPLAPVGFTNSTRIPVYRRGDILPPRGVVFLAYGTGYLMNSLYATRPELKEYPNTEEGALAFITEQVYAKTQTVSWGDNVFNNGWQSVLQQINGPVNQTRYNPGTREIITNIAPSLGYDGSTYTYNIATVSLLGTCPTEPFPNPDNCPPIDPGSICVPDAECFTNLACIFTGCYSAGLLPCSFTPESCTAYYEVVLPGSSISLTTLSYIPLTYTTSFSVYIS